MANKTIALVGCDTSDDIKNALIEKDFRLLVLPYDNRLPSPVRSHTDMLIFPIEDHIFTSSEYFNKAHDIFSVLCEYGYNIVKCDVEITDKYPHDIAFNMAILKKSILNLQNSSGQIGNGWCGLENVYLTPNSCGNTLIEMNSTSFNGLGYYENTIY